MPALNLATVFAGISIALPVLGLRPVRAALLDTEKVPKPVRTTDSPFDNELVTLSRRDCKARLASALVIEAFSAIAATKKELA